MINNKILIKKTFELKKLKQKYLKMKQNFYIYLLYTVTNFKLNFLNES